ncbi:uncharacterized protein PAC_16590 [Phialocephala subalpina]|uniref:Uncharacterized protein n=1 Tax=Phialocephala subalpina TaxID=576137 RepID=A0A1L7XNT3_9HELO|nr:uncharacterized protein PAC_16590 [Phialocephala subalpina]
MSTRANDSTHTGGIGGVKIKFEERHGTVFWIKDFGEQSKDERLAVPYHYFLESLADDDLRKTKDLMHDLKKYGIQELMLVVLEKDQRLVTRLLSPLLCCPVDVIDTGYGFSIGGELLDLSTATCAQLDRVAKALLDNYQERAKVNWNNGEAIDEDVSRDVTCVSCIQCEPSSLPPQQRIILAIGP